LVDLGGEKKFREGISPATCGRETKIQNRERGGGGFGRVTDEPKLKPGSLKGGSKKIVRRVEKKPGRTEHLGRFG